MPSKSVLSFISKYRTLLEVRRRSGVVLLGINKLVHGLTRMIRGFQLTEGGFASMDILVVPVIPMLQCIITMLVMIIGFMTLRTSIKRVLAPMKPVKDFMIGFSLVGIVVLFILNIILLHDFELRPNGYGQRSDGSYCLDRNTFLDVGERLVLIKPPQPPSIPEKLQLTSQIQAGSLCNDCSKTKLISTCFDRHIVYMIWRKYL